MIPLKNWLSLLHAERRRPQVSSGGTNLNFKKAG
jgi:hypothetical protein